jgi:hypothetical protein
LIAATNADTLPTSRGPSGFLLSRIRPRSLTSTQLLAPLLRLDFFQDSMALLRYMLSMRLRRMVADRASSSATDHSPENPRS